MRSPRKTKGGPIKKINEGVVHGSQIDGGERRDGKKQKER